MKFRILLCLAVFFGLGAQAQIRSGYTELEDSETVAALRAHVSFLSSAMLEGRKAGSEGEQEAAAYVWDCLKANGAEMLSDRKGDVFGLASETGDTLYSRNIVGVVQGYDHRMYDNYIVVAARMDNLGLNELTVDGQKVRQTYYGANGNSSGLALMLELSRMVSSGAIMFRRSIVFLGLGASCEGFAGAMYFLGSSFSGKIDAAIDLDCVGIGGPFYAFTCSNEDLNALVRAQASSLQPVQPQLTAQEIYPADHRAFYSSGIPSVTFSTGHYPEHNTHRDTPDILDYDQMERELEYVYNFTKILANADSAPAFSSQTGQPRKEAEGLYAASDCDERPTFLGHSDPRFFMEKWVYQYLKYPATAARDGIQGRVHVRFCIEKDGSVSDVEVVRGVDPALDAEAVKVISASPKWKAAKVGGSRVKSYMTLPVEFVLEKKGKKSFGIKK